jgi:hypothetical protein
MIGRPVALESSTAGHCSSLDTHCPADIAVEDHLFESSSHGVSAHLCRQCFRLAISPKGDRLIYAHPIDNTSICAVEPFIALSAKSAKAAPRSFIASSQEQLTAGFSPDGQQIAFESTRTGPSEIWGVDRDGSHARQLTQLHGRGLPYLSALCSPV